MAKQNTVEKINEIIKPYAEQLGVDIWDIRFTKEGSEWYLRIFIDKPNGVSIDDCVDLTHAISKPLDESDPISQSYILEVSSPGVERELVKDEHFIQYIGSNVLIRTIRPINAVRDFSAVLTDYKDKKITVTLKDGSQMTFDKKETSFIKLDDFEMKG